MDTIGILVDQLGALPMLWFVIMQILSTVIECVWLGCKTDREKDLEILLLRRQLDIVDRARDKPLRVTRAEKLRVFREIGGKRYLWRYQANKR